METLIWVNLIACGFLFIACVGLFLDGRGKARAIAALQAALATAHKRLGSQDEQIGYLARAVAMLVPADARATTAAPQPAMAGAVVGLSRPFVPSPEQVAVARSVPSGAVSGPFSESREAMRARIEGDADERSLARVALPPPSVEGPEGDEPEDEPTTFYGPGPKPRPTLLGGLAGAPLERPASSAARTVEAFRKAHPSSPTLVSAGVEPRARETLTPTDPTARPLDARVSRRWAELVAGAQAKGDDAAHCHGPLCMTRTEETELCECQCDGCGLLLELLVQAEQEIRRERGQE